jgi:transcriptional activator FlhC
MSRVTDLTNAQDVILAHDMARVGGTPQLLERLTGFGARWARAVVKEECGVQPAHRRKDDPAVWFEKDSERILHGYYVVKAYRRTNTDDHRASRLIEAYNTYRELSSDPILDINHCADIIELAETGMAWERTCSSCRMRHLVVTEHYECPVCRRLQAMLCKGCGDVLPEPNKTERRGRPRLYCNECETNRASRVLKSKRDRRAHIHQAAVG